MSVVEDGSVYQVGTYNGNPLSMAAARASLEQVLTPEAYRHLDALNDRIVSRLRRGDRAPPAARLRRRRRLEGLRDVLADADRRLRDASRPTRTSR